LAGKLWRFWREEVAACSRVARVGDGSFKWPEMC
jgi:hypothetical protein